MGKRRKKKAVTLAKNDYFDVGPKTAAARQGLIIEEAKIWDEKKGKYVNPNGVKRARRIDMCESYHKRGKITDRQRNAATKLRDAWEATMKSPPSLNFIQVDSCPKPDKQTAMMIDRISKFAAIMKRVPKGSKVVIDAVVLENQSIGYLKKYRAYKFEEGLAALQAGLDAVADGLGV